MTQPASPYAPLQGLPGFGGNAAPLTGLPGFSPQQVQQPGTPPPGAAGLFQGEANATARFDATRPAMPGALTTAATQFGRGAFDTLLASGALLGAALEGTGDLTGVQGLEDFGRDLGKSSSGSAAAEAAAFLFGGGGQKGLSYAERADQAIREQEQAWPLLTAVSRIGGGVALTLGAGALAGGATAGAAATLRGLTSIGAYEGGAAGVQAAYERNEAFRDVIVSGLTGAAFGAAGGAAIHGVGALPGKIGAAIDERNAIKQIFGDIKTAADDVADAVRQAGGKEVYDAAKTILSERARVLKEVASAGENPSLMRMAYDKATRAAGERISALAGDFDPGSWATKTPTAMQKLLHRTPLLDRVADDLGQDVAQMAAARPSLDFDLKVPGKLLKDANKTAAIGGLQSRVTAAIEQAADTPLRNLLFPVAERLTQTGAADSMALGHGLVRQLTAAAASAPDELTASMASRLARSIADELGGEAWGGAGKAYRTLTSPPSQLSQVDAKALREGLRHADSSRAIPGLVKEEAEQLTGAYAARKQLGGEYLDDGVKQLLKDAGVRAEKAHAAVTFDGAPARRVLDVLTGAGRNIGESYASDILGMGVGAAIGGVPGMLVARALAPVLGDVASAAFGKAVAGAGQKAGRQFASKAVKAASSGAKDSARGGIAWQQFDYTDAVKKLSEMVSGGSDMAASRDAALASLPAEIQLQASGDMQQRFTQLLADLPKPQPDIRGEAFEGLSQQDLIRAQAMTEATMDPMSVFSDFAGGSINYDKAQYAWKQYPGLQQAAQAGLMDVIHAQLSKDDRKGITDGILTQLDSLLGFKGELQPTSAHAFAMRMEQLMQPAPQNPPPRPGGKLQTPLSSPTFTQRLSGQRG